MNQHLRPVEIKCAICEKSFIPSPRPNGGGRVQKYCSKSCCQKRYLLKDPEKRKATVLKYESKEENKERKTKCQRARRLKLYGWTEKDFQKELQRQNYSCYGCLRRIDEKSAKLDHKHGEEKVRPRGLLCDLCNRGLGYMKESAATMRRLTAYLDHDRSLLNIYLIGALKNNRIPEIGNILRSQGYDVMDEWFTPGKEADENWQKYEKLRGRSYGEALRGRAATNIFLFDRSYLDLADVVILVAPAGKSAMIELGYAKGRGKKAYILLDGVDPERFDIMPGFADKIFVTEVELLEHLKSYNQ
jgi:hypothetical protein